MHQKILRIFSALLGICYIIAGFLGFFFVILSVLSILVGIYVIIAGFLLLFSTLPSSKLHQWTITYFGFLDTLKGKAAFLILFGSLMIGLGVFPIIIGIISIIFGIIHILVVFIVGESSSHYIQQQQHFHEKDNLTDPSNNIDAEYVTYNNFNNPHNSMSMPMPAPPPPHNPHNSMNQASLLHPL